MVRGAQPERPNILFALADDWSWPHAGIYGDKFARTPVFDRVAREGVVFNRAYCNSPSCTPSRGAMLTGQASHRLEEGGNLWSILPKKFPVYPDILESAGYFVGYEIKGWGPGSLLGSGRTRNPAGPVFRDFEQFLRDKPAAKPFCYWFGSRDPHRQYVPGSGIAGELKPEDVVVPPFLPDTPEVRRDLLDYYFAVQRFDRRVGDLLQLLEASGQFDRTLVVITSDNGMPFPRAKANLYDYGTHMPLVMRWPGRFRPGTVIDDFVSFCDFAPTFLQAGGLKPLPEMTGRSLLSMIDGKERGNRDMVFTERERHSNVRKGDLSYPSRAVRTREFLYIRNLKPDRWPVGDPEKWKAGGAFGDIENSPAKKVLVEGQKDPRYSRLFRLGFDKRPEEELYDLAKDPDEFNNVAGLPEYSEPQRRLRAAVGKWMKDTSDPRALGGGDEFDRYPSFQGGGLGAGDSPNAPPRTETETTPR
jgi:arylsulfatase A-like enzyme